MCQRTGRPLVKDIGPLSAVLLAQSSKREPRLKPQHNAPREPGQEHARALPQQLTKPTLATHLSPSIPLNIPYPPV